MSSITVLLVDDHTILRKGLRSLLEQPGIEVIAEAEDGRQAIEAVEKFRPNIVVMDISMPSLNGLEATRQILKRVPDTKVLILSRHSAQEYFEQLLKAGASGYLTKKSAPEELIVAILAIYRGDTYLDPSISNIVLEKYLETKTLTDLDILTDRQREVLQLIAEGQSNREIASKLIISVKTVENHRTNILKRLGLQSTAELIQYAIRHRIVSLDN